MVEGGSWDKIVAGMYRGEYSKESYIATLFSFMAKYSIRINFVSKEFAPTFIYNSFKYFLRDNITKKSGGNHEQNN